ncbi:MAG: indole-3-glycerol-phosphate synthase, partial [Actinobacteria bacterium]
VANRRARIAAEYGSLSASDLERLAAAGRPARDFTAALAGRNDVAVIAEVKKASPSAGAIAPDCEASKQALHYANGGAAAISVLTEPEQFGGSWTDLSDVCDAVDVPVLCKDFVVAEPQLFAARGCGADAVLLMVSVLGDRTPAYADLARTLGLEPLVEVVSLAELETARAAGARVVDVNSRDLRTLAVDADAAGAAVWGAARAGVTRVFASGVSTREDVEAAAACGADAVLVGESLMRAAYPEDLLAELTGVRKSGAPVR